MHPIKLDMEDRENFVLILSDPKNSYILFSVGTDRTTFPCHYFAYLIHVKKKMQPEHLAEPDRDLRNLWKLWFPCLQKRVQV